MAKKKSEVKRPRGHPTDYKPEYCALLIEHFKTGKSYAAFAALCDVCRDTLYEWEKKNPLFSDAKKRGWEHYQAYWEEIGREGVYNQTFKDGDGVRTVSVNSAVWIYNMKCRFKEDWYDSQKIEADVKQTTEVASEIKDLAAWLRRVKEIK